MPSQHVLKARDEAARPVAVAMHDIEESLNTALVRIGTLFTTIGHARMDRGARMPLTVAMAATEKAAQLAATEI